MEHSLYEQVFRLQQSHWWFAARRNSLDSLLGGQSTGGNVLDAGCGPGSMLGYLSKYGRVTGLDPYPPALEMARKRFAGPLVMGEIGSLPFADGSFDLVGTFEVLYHKGIADVEDAVRELARVLAPGGRLVVVDSAYPSLASAHDLAAHSARRFTMEQMREIFEKAGLNVTRSTYAYCALLPVVWVVRRLKGLLGLDRRPEAELSPAPEWLNAAMIRWFRLETAVAGVFGLPFGLSLQIAGEKPRVNKN
ncbi:MAG: class I SAM-dependent methyltransferase [Nitrospinae bacterium]|nr:class I SAM-dependent methyltransferase [Nitrospinota bacterium]